jgi:uncharacterized membrane protein
MKLRGGDRDRDLAVTTALAMIALVVLVLPLPHWLQAAFALILLILPGYALAAAIFPPGFITKEERWVFTIAFSIVTAALGGVVLQLFVDLGRGVWIVLLLMLTLGLCAVALRRRGPRRRAVRGRPLTFNPSLTATLLAATAICAVAIAVASDGASDQLARSHFSSLWLLPTDAEESELSVNVENHEGRTVHYTVRVGSLQQVDREWAFVLRSGESWSARVPAARFGLASFASLYRGKALFRRVSFQPRVVR